MGVGAAKVDNLTVRREVSMSLCFAVTGSKVTFFFTSFSLFGCLLSCLAFFAAFWESVTGTEGSGMDFRFLANRSGEFSVVGGSQCISEGVGTFCK